MSSAGPDGKLPSAATQAGEELGLRILAIKRFDREELLATLRETPLRGFGKARVYSDATLRLAPATDTDSLRPAQRYLLRPALRKVLELRAALLPWGIDMFSLEGGAYIHTSESPEEAIPIIPPIVERSREPDGSSVLLINDGLHRVSAAKQLGLPISVVVVSGVPLDRPYYAYALPGGWAASERTTIGR